VTSRLFTLLIALAYRRARRMGGMLWWAVIALAIVARYLDRRVPLLIRRRWRVREGREMNIVVSQKATK